MWIITDDDLIAFDINEGNRKYLIGITDKEWDEIGLKFHELIYHHFQSELPFVKFTYIKADVPFSQYLRELIELKRGMK
jgi:hypothetical protein